MGASFARAAGEPYIDPTPPRSPSPSRSPSPIQSPLPGVEREGLVELVELKIDGVECCVCHETPLQNYICCVNGHGGCTACMHREKLRSKACPLCRLPMLDRLIPNLTLDRAVEQTFEAQERRCVKRERTQPQRTDPAAKRRKLAALHLASASLGASPLDL